MRPENEGTSIYFIVPFATFVSMGYVAALSRLCGRVGQRGYPRLPP